MPAQRSRPGIGSVATLNTRFASPHSATATLMMTSRAFAVFCDWPSDRFRRQPPLPQPRAAIAEKTYHGDVALARHGFVVGAPRLLGAPEPRHEIGGQRPIGLIVSELRNIERVE